MIIWLDPIKSIHGMTSHHNHKAKGRDGQSKLISISISFRFKHAHHMTTTHVRVYFDANRKFKCLYRLNFKCSSTCLIYTFHTLYHSVYIYAFISRFPLLRAAVSYLSGIQTPKALVLDLVKHCGEVTEDPDAEMSTSAMLSLGKIGPTKD